MDQNELARIFNDSFERVMNAPQKTEFFYAFYALLIANSPEAAQKLRDTEMVNQIRMLQASVHVLLAFYSAGGEAAYLQKLAERHSRQGADIPPKLYSVWLDCLVESVGQFDSKFNHDVELAWRGVFSKGVEFMTSRYEGRT